MKIAWQSRLAPDDGCGAHRGTTKVDFSLRPTLRPASSTELMSNCIGWAPGPRRRADSGGTRTLTATQRACAAADLDRLHRLGRNPDARLAGDADQVALRLLGGVHQLQAVDVLELAVLDTRASAPRSRTTSTRNGVRSARLATKPTEISSRIAL